MSVERRSGEPFGSSSVVPHPLTVTGVPAGVETPLPTSTAGRMPGASVSSGCVSVARAASYGLTSAVRSKSGMPPQVAICTRCPGAGVASRSASPATTSKFVAVSTWPFPFQSRQCPAVMTCRASTMTPPQNWLFHGGFGL